MQALASESNPDSAVHYDIAPEIFELILDKNMNYSSGVYRTKLESLDTAQELKMDQIAHVTGLTKGGRVLDVGCGWSGPALYFAENYGCDITGINLSKSQREHGLNWAKARNLEDRISIDVCNVANMPYEPESFDQIMFLESIIHMPDKEKIFQDCFKLLKPGGRIFVQESNYDRGSMTEKYRSDAGYKEFDLAFGYTTTMLSGGQMLCLMEEAGFLPLHLEDIGVDYTITLSQWLKNMDHHRDEIMAISKDNFLMLRRYLMLALNTYRTRHTLCHQITAEKPMRAA